MNTSGLMALLFDAREDYQNLRQKQIDLFEEYVLLVKEHTNSDLEEVRLLLACFMEDSHSENARCMLQRLNLS